MQNIIDRQVQIQNKESDIKLLKESLENFFGESSIEEKRSLYLKVLHALTNLQIILPYYYEKERENEMKDIEKNQSFKINPLVFRNISNERKLYCTPIYVTKLEADTSIQPELDLGKNIGYFVMNLPELLQYFVNDSTTVDGFVLFCEKRTFVLALDYLKEIKAALDNVKNKSKESK